MGGQTDRCGWMNKRMGGQTDRCGWMNE